MPELPEVEVVRRDLAAETEGRSISAVAVTGRRTVRRQDPAGLVGRLRGVPLGKVERIGKFLVVRLADDTGGVLVVHLRMSGQLRLCAPGDPVIRHTHAVVSLSDGRELRFVDTRTFGELFVAQASGARPPELAHIGPDLLDAVASPADLAEVLAGRSVAVKTLLMDQRRLAGLGNIYSDEALFAAGIRFDRPAGTLHAGEVDALHGAIGSTLRAAVEHRGSSLADGTYVDLYGAPGRYQAHHQVYGRAGRPCRRCGAEVQRRPFAGRSTFWCARCQR